MTPKTRDRRDRLPERPWLGVNLRGTDGARVGTGRLPPSTFAAGGAVGVVLVALLAVLVPLPTLLLDLLLAGALAFGVALLVAAITVERPHELAGFPALLLGATLLRLAVNVSTTRRILGTADAGRVIDAFATVVAGRDLVVGLVVFGIVTMLQWMVVARGAERIAEVAARFSLDAMPGEQAAIDVDLRAGSISSTEAALRRTRLIERARFHGAMDGAMRFVKGDALLGLAITATNLAGGLAVGLLREGMTAAEAVQVYGRLTIGDGLAMQIPSVLTSLAAGMLVARAEREDGVRPGLSAKIRVSWVATPATLCVGLALVPGMPTAAFLAVGLALAAAAWWLAQRRETPAIEDAQIEIELLPDPEMPSRGVVLTLVQQLGHELGIGPVRCTVLTAPPVVTTSQPPQAPSSTGDVDDTAASSIRLRIGGRDVTVNAAATRPRRTTDEANVLANDTTAAQRWLVAIRAAILDDADGLVNLGWIEANVQRTRRTDSALVDRVLRRVDVLDLLLLVRHLLRERIPVPDFGVVLRVLVERIERSELEPREAIVALARTKLAPWWLPELIEALGGVEHVGWHRTTPDFEDAVATLVPVANKLPVDLSLAEAPRRTLVRLREALTGATSYEAPTVVLTSARVRPLLAVLAREASPRVWVLSREEFERGVPREPKHMAWLDVPVEGA